MSGTGCDGATGLLTGFAGSGGWAVETQPDSATALAPIRKLRRLNTAAFKPENAASWEFLRDILELFV
ncbi:hypothetical protein OHAE_3934 [Ochrobactrum soli]|uniref:Uncharacterized protein n=1 Tax=Ochrobactrum soli TaxID=2448455 RepID=A0A2P9HIV1_9HYPH|nr:hypothetical protein OHAE_3934 [[Ochrobactrum] soli]